jgi:PIN domain nuclease of toxin-antitoxin system
VIVLDTHVWLWWTAAPQKLSRAATRAIERADRIGVSTMSVFELVELVERRRIKLDSPAGAWVRDALARERVEPVPVTPDIAVEAARLRFVGDPVDRIVYASARVQEAQLVTRDQRMREFDAGRTVW